MDSCVPCDFIQDNSEFTILPLDQDYSFLMFTPLLGYLICYYVVGVAIVG